MLIQLHNIAITDITQGGWYTLELQEYHAPNEHIIMHIYCKLYFLQTHQLQHQSIQASTHQGHVNNMEKFKNVMGLFTDQVAAKCATTAILQEDHTQLCAAIRNINSAINNLQMQ